MRAFSLSTFSLKRDASRVGRVLLGKFERTERRSGHKVYYLQRTKMRPLTDEESKQVFPKLSNYIVRFQ